MDRLRSREGPGCGSIRPAVWLLTDCGNAAGWCGAGVLNLDPNLVDFRFRVPRVKL